MVVFKVCCWRIPKQLTLKNKHPLGSIMQLKSIRLPRLYNVAITIIAIDIIVFFLQVFLGSSFTDSLIFVSQDAFSRPWIFITHMFLHAGPYHLLFNMYALFLFGPLIEERIGPKRFLFIYLLSGIAAALPYTLVPTRSLGASAAIMGIIGVTVMLMPNLRLLLFFAIPMTLRSAAIVFVILDLFGIFFSPGVANLAHIIGLGCGLLFGYYLMKRKDKYHERITEKAFGGIKNVHKDRGNASNIELSKDDIDEYLRYGRL